MHKEYRNGSYEHKIFKESILYFQLFHFVHTTDNLGFFSVLKLLCKNHGSGHLPLCDVSLHSGVLKCMDVNLLVYPLACYGSACACNLNTIYP